MLWENNPPEYLQISDLSLSQSYLIIIDLLISYMLLLPAWSDRFHRPAVRNCPSLHPHFWSHRLSHGPGQSGSNHQWAGTVTSAIVKNNDLRGGQIVTPSQFSWPAIEQFEWLGAPFKDLSLAFCAILKPWTVRTSLDVTQLGFWTWSVVVEKNN